MPRTTATAETPNAPTDPYRTIAEAMERAVQATRDGAADAKGHVVELMPAVGGFLSRLTYHTCYAVSYGVVLPTLIVARAIPRENALVYGLVDGAAAARDSLKGSDRASEGAGRPGADDAQGSMASAETDAA